VPAVTRELDLSKLGELEALLGTNRTAIVRTLVTELTAALARIDQGLSDGDLAEVAAAAHAARNSALMIDAQPLLGVLKQLEACARRDEPEGASAARARLAGVWPPLRSKLELAAGP
jgi:HPt (histidine-containing phosphotransfer) domain-containing protein